MSHPCPKCARTFASRPAVNAHQAVHKRANLFTLADIKKGCAEMIRIKLGRALDAGQIDLTNFDRAMKVIDEVLK